MSPVGRATAWPEAQRANGPGADPLEPASEQRIARPRGDATGAACCATAVQRPAARGCFRGEHCSRVRDAKPAPLPRFCHGACHSVSRPHPPVEAYWAALQAPCVHAAADPRRRVTITGRLLWRCVARAGDAATQARHVRLDRAAGLESPARWRGVTTRHDADRLRATSSKHRTASVVQP
jgi:hypothetical protein